jgi:hypothetical protein
MKERSGKQLECKQQIRFSLIKLLLQKKTQKQRIPESRLSKKLNIINKL